MSEEIVRGPSGTIRFRAQRCIHSRNCVLDRPDVFAPNTPGESIHPERADAGELASLARNCPSGAIRYELPDGGEGEAAPLVNTVRIRENGPLAFHGELVIATQAGERRATLCRCGASANKPFCDASHAAAGFAASGEVVPVEFLGPSAARRTRERGADPERPAACLRRPRNRHRNRQDRQSTDGDMALPLRPLEKQALLRRQPQGGRISGVSRAAHARSIRPQ